MEEYFDVVDDRGIPTGETVTRSEAHEKGICHRTAHVWIVRQDSEGRTEVLLQKRSTEKDSFPGCYDTSSAGHIDAGDEPLESALRELGEELGIHAQKEELCPIGTFRISYKEAFHGKPFVDEEIAFVYVYLGRAWERPLVLQKEEIESVRWFLLQEVVEAVEKKEKAFCVPPGGLKLVAEYARRKTGM